MSYEGQLIQVSVTDGIAELVFDAKAASVNVFNRATLSEAEKAIEFLEQTDGIKGLIVSSAKSTFIVGADITEFADFFTGPEEDILEWLSYSNGLFNRVEDLPYPSVTTVNGTALGGGCEMTLATDYRVMSNTANIGLPEIKLGIIPGFGGTVRLPRLIGADNAIEIISAGKSVKADEALKIGLVDAVVAGDLLKTAAERLLTQAIEGKFDWEARRAQKTGKLKLNATDQMMCFMTAKGFVAGKAGKHYPAPVEAIKSMEKGAGKTRDGALIEEAKRFAKLARTDTALALSGLFGNDQLIKGKGRAYAKVARKVERAAVLGAGIMGGGIAYQSACKSVPIVMKDIRDDALALGMGEASKLLNKQVSRGKYDAAKMGQILGRIRPTLGYDDFKEVDLVVEAVVENEGIKKSVLADVERACPEGAIITSNTSSISITRLAEALEKPENFCGMHFFNPVHRMPLVEVIRGEKSSEEAIATTVSYASALGKTPIVVGDCPGFLVNRVLFPYFAGFQALVNDGVAFERIDTLMEDFGWPMGPAYLLDVVGIDTGHHVGEVLAEGYPERMSFDIRTSLDVMYEAQRFGQKNGKGYYMYAPDKKGKPKKMVDPEVAGMIAAVQRDTPIEISDEAIIDRMMLPMIIETARCLEEGIVDTPNEADMGLIMGLGFPPFRGGALRYADFRGLSEVVARCDELASMGALYEPTETMRKMAADGGTFYP